MNNKNYKKKIQQELKINKMQKFNSFNKLFHNIILKIKLFF